MTKEIPIRAAQEFAEQFGKDQVIIVSYSKEDGLTWVTTYGKDIESSDQAAKGGNWLKKNFLRWPEFVDEPHRVRKLKEEIERLKSEDKKPISRPKIICICGSSKFVDTMAVKAWELEKEGNIVFSLHLLPQWYSNVPNHLAELEGVVDTLDQLHLEKIALSDEILVMNVQGYIGHQTQKEIEFAKALQKPVKYLEEPIHEKDR